MKGVLGRAAVILLCAFTLAACDEGPADGSDATGSGALAAAKPGGGGGGTTPNAVTVGGLIYNDATLSLNQNQSCATCHQPAQGFAAPLSGATTQGSVVQGSVAGQFGDRKPPSAAYATIAPLFSGGSNPTGGNFWDGRATGQVLGNPAADQAMGPFLNPKEQALPHKACVLYRVKLGYGATFTTAWGTALNTIAFPSDMATLCRTPGSTFTFTAAENQTIETQYGNVARSIQQFEATFNKYTSRSDLGQMNAQEQLGAKVFSAKGKCHTCHTAKGAKPPFTDFAFHNLGLPKNPENPVYNYASGSFDPGLGGFTNNAAHLGKFRTPTVRNTGMGTGRTYMHNGVFTSLEQVVDFYSTRDVLPRCTDAQSRQVPLPRYGSAALGGIGCWPAPEYPQNLDANNMGNLGLTVDEVRAIAAFMRALSDQ